MISTTFIDESDDADEPLFCGGGGCFNGSSRSPCWQIPCSEVVHSKVAIDAAIAGATVIDSNIRTRSLILTLADRPVERLIIAD